jgi:urease accessory protein
MTLDADTLFAVLQHGDGQFPSGAFAFSWGLEGLWTEARLRRPDVPVFVLSQLRHRWAKVDRVALVAAHRAGDNLERILGLDREIETLSLVRSMRVGSRRAGGALLGIHQRLGTPGAAEYHRLVQVGSAPGHVAVVQAVVWRGCGLPEPVVEVLSAYSLASGMLTAAIRLRAIGHVDAQRSLRDCQAVAAEIVSEAVKPPYRMATFNPIAEIAMMRHERQNSRLFAN